MDFVSLLSLLSLMYWMILAWLSWLASLVLLVPYPQAQLPNLNSRWKVRHQSKTCLQFKPEMMMSSSNSEKNNSAYIVGGKYWRIWWWEECKPKSKLRNFPLVSCYFGLSTWASELTHILYIKVIRGKVTRIFDPFIVKFLYRSNLWGISWEVYHRSICEPREPACPA